MLISGQMNLFILLILALLMINPESKKQGDVTLKAEMIMSVEWNDAIDCDVDVWVRGPNGSIASFRSKDVGYMHIDRDDTGLMNDRVTTIDGEFTRDFNAEYWTLRTIIPGEYTVSVHLYACRMDGVYTDRGSVEELLVNVKLTDLNPVAEVIAQKTVTLSEIFQEEHVFRFNLNEIGYTTRIWSEPIKLVQVDTVP